MRAATEFFDMWTGHHVRTRTAYTDTWYYYDPQGRLKTVTVNKLNGVDLTDPLVTGYTYDNAGNLHTVTQDNGTEDTSDDLTTTYEYDDLNRLDTLTVKLGSLMVFTQDYDCYSDGNRSGVLEIRYEADGETEASRTQIDWEYDADGRLTSETRDEGDDDAQNGGDYTDTYSFDLAGNRTKKVHDAVGTDHDETIDYTYDQRDRLTAEDSDFTNNAHDASYTYDANGSTLTKTQGAATTDYTWDVRNRLASATVGGITTTYGYDSTGQRISERTDSGDTTYFLNDNNNPTGYPQVLEEKVGTVPSTATLSRSYILQNIRGHHTD